MTTQDLEQIGNMLDARLDAKLESLRQDVSTLKDDVSSIKAEQQKMQSKMTGMSRRLTRAAKDISYIVRTFDEDIAATRKRVERIEDHLDLPAIH